MPAFAGMTTVGLGPFPAHVVRPAPVRGRGSFAQSKAYAKLALATTLVRGQALNWLDVVVLVTWAAGLIVGWKLGLFGAVFVVVGAFLGVLLASRFSDDVADFLTESVSSDTLATVIAYVAILLAVGLATVILRAVVKGVFSKALLGWIDPVGGMALGLLAGILLAGAFVSVLARYSSDLPTELSDEARQELIRQAYEPGLKDRLGYAAAEGALATILDRSEVQQKLRNSLVGSNMVGFYLKARDVVPGAAFGLVPEDFDLALALLKVEIEAAKGDASD